MTQTAQIDLIGMIEAVSVHKCSLSMLALNLILLLHHILKYITTAQYM